MFMSVIMSQVSSVGNLLKKCLSWLVFSSAQLWKNGSRRLVVLMMHGDWIVSMSGCPPDETVS